MPLAPKALAALAVTLIPLLGAPASGRAQYRLVAPSGVELTFESDSLLQMRERSRALRLDLEEDPAVLYYTLFGRPLEPDAAEAAYPWNAVDVVTDSLAAVVTPGNLREADRAYVNYAVLRMRAVRDDPDVSCEEIVSREVGAVIGFVEGWIVARTLFGGPAFEPLDELAFAWSAGVLPGFIAAHANPQLGGCLAVWGNASADEIEAYRAWRQEEFRGGP